ncbi:MAG: hypothetical protein Q8O67_00925 [Deltaproteobacteria bacterium]|nr:hypothetical protein [Deltaproteobacteria bacterium]
MSTRRTSAPVAPMTTTMAALLVVCWRARVRVGRVWPAIARCDRQRFPSEA